MTEDESTDAGLTSTQAAERLGVTRQAVARYIRNGDLHATKRPHGMDWYYVISESDLQAFISKHGQSPNK